jgi:S-disulfanyl-L-cysteine oxidoreductase SoxD
VSPKREPQWHVGLCSLAALFILLAISLTPAPVCAVTPVSPDRSSTGGAAKSVLAGVYSPEQRRSGMHLYLKECSSCHGERLRGGESGPTLIGAAFRQHWVGRTLNDFIQKINAMPPKDPGRLTPEQAASVIAVILAANGYPAGDKDLASTSIVLQQIRLESPNPP